MEITLIAYMLCWQQLNRNGQWRVLAMFGRSAAMPRRTAVDIVRDCLEQGPPTGLRLGSAQTAGRLTLFPVFHDRLALEYLTLSDAQMDGTAQITQVGGDG